MLQPEKKSFADTIKKKPSEEKVTQVAAPAASIGTQTYAEADRKKGGRPKKAEADKSSKNRVVLYFTDEELELVQETVKQIGMPVATYVKAAVLEKIKNSH